MYKQLVTSKWKSILSQRKKQAPRDQNVIKMRLMQVSNFANPVPYKELQHTKWRQ